MRAGAVEWGRTEPSINMVTVSYSVLTSLSAPQNGFGPGLTLAYGSGRSNSKACSPPGGGPRQPLLNGADDHVFFNP